MSRNYPDRRIGSLMVRERDTPERVAERRLAAEISRKVQADLAAAFPIIADSETFQRADAYRIEREQHYRQEARRGE